MRLPVSSQQITDGTPEASFALSAPKGWPFVHGGSTPELPCQVTKTAVVVTPFPVVHAQGICAALRRELGG